VYFNKKYIYEKNFLSLNICFGIKWYIITRVLAYVIALFMVFNINKFCLDIKQEFIEILDGFYVLHKNIKPYFNLEVLFRLVVVYSVPH
jgi:hypothetical protein